MSITNHETTDGTHEECLGDDCVLIAGGGPVGLVLATILASYGVKSVLLERNETTTKYNSWSCGELLSEISNDA